MLVLGRADGHLCGLVNFQTASKALESQLVKDGHFWSSASTAAGHAEPPLDAPSMLTKYAAFWGCLRIPYWLGTGEVAPRRGGLPPSFPSWCSGRWHCQDPHGICTRKARLLTVASRLALERVTMASFVQCAAPRDATETA